MGLAFGKFKEQLQEVFEPESKPKDSTTSRFDIIFKPIKDFTSWLFGDPQNVNFQTRKTFFETLLGIFGFFIIGRIIKDTFNEEIEI